jgi:UDP-N-acetylglucosamine/UDP-N-acetylgalactosamine diphosphorylase
MIKMQKEILKREFPTYKKYIDDVFKARQPHIFRWWDEIPYQEKRHLLEQIASIDFRFIDNLFHDNLRKNVCIFRGNLMPPQVITVSGRAFEKAEVQRVKQIGGHSLQEGKIAVLTVAGGDGTRLGTDGPKGILPIAPISQKSIFQFHAEKIRAIQQRYHTRIPWYIMTSEKNNLATQDFFQSCQFFGLDPHLVQFFTQRMLPVVDLQGNLLMDSKYNIIMSPNGHGGTLIALKEKGILDDMKRRGIENIFYHQVDNILVKIADPVFIGYHLRDKAEMSLKVVKKRHPEEKVGIVGYLDGELRMIEYSELSREDMHARNEDGTLRYAAGNIAVHMIRIDFLERLYQIEESLPYHAAIKKVPYVDENGMTIVPEENNAMKFESFIFDVLKYVKRSVIMEVLREEEFSPVKNMEGEDCPATARQAMVNLFGRWLQNAGVTIPFDPQGNVLGTIEISPCFALDEEELGNKVDKDLQFHGFLNL